MIHYDTRCYCDSDCLHDCCEDVKTLCFDSQQKSSSLAVGTNETINTEIIYDYLVSTEFPGEIESVVKDENFLKTEEYEDNENLFERGDN